MKTQSYFIEAILLLIFFVFLLIAYRDFRDRIEDLQKENAILKHQCDSLQVGIDTTGYLIYKELINANYK